MRTALLVCCALLSAAAASAELTVAASVSSSRIVLGEQVVLSVAITGSGSASPKIPPIPDVEIYETGKSQSMSIINGAVSSSVNYAFVLQPRKAGKFRVPAVEVAGAAPTQPIDVEVLAANAPPPAASPPGANPASAPRPGAQSPDVFVTAALQKNRAFVNEQVTLVVRFFTAVSLLGSPQYDAPKLAGLLSESLGAEGQGTTSVGGRIYSYSEIKTALFPVQGGRASVGPAVVTVQTPRRGLGDTGDDFFDRFFGMSAPETRRLTSEPLALQVDPLPPGQPDDFSGVVGKLAVDASVDRTKVKAGEAVTLTVSVRGTGNIKSLPEPKRPDLPGARFFDSDSSVALTRSGDALGGTKTFRAVLVPRVSGTLDIPPLTVSYFDADKRAYVRARSAPLRLTVLPGDPNAAAPAAGPAPAPGVTAVAEDIRYLQAPDGRSAAARALGDALAAFGAPGPRHALPFAFFLVSALYDWRRRRLKSDPSRARQRGARAAAERRLREAASGVAPARAVSLLAEALAGYCADMLGLPAAGLTLKSAVERLRAAPRPPGDGCLARLKTAWEELDLLRFAPGAADQAEVARLAGEIRALTLELDKELQP